MEYAAISNFATTKLPNVRSCIKKPKSTIAQFIENVELLKINHIDLVYKHVINENAKYSASGVFINSPFCILQSKFGNC